MNVYLRLLFAGSLFFFFSSRRRHTRSDRDWSSDVCSSDLVAALPEAAAPAPAARTVYLVDKPGAAQSVIRIGHVGVARATPDYFALQVLNTILGGAFTSRLNQNLRETHGYTYGAFSQFSAGRLAGPFVASASVVTAKHHTP